MAKFRVLVIEVRRVKAVYEINRDRYDIAVRDVIQSGEGEVISMSQVDNASQDRVLNEFLEIPCTFRNSPIDWNGEGYYKLFDDVWKPADSISLVNIAMFVTEEEIKEEK